MKGFHWQLQATIIMSAYCLTQAKALSPAHAMSFGNPVTAQSARAIVQVQNNYYSQGPCSGVLVAPDIVLTAGHCTIGIKVPSTLCQFLGCDPNDSANLPEHPLQMFNGKWQEFPLNSNVTVTVTSNTGATPNNAVFTSRAFEFNSPPYTSSLGHADIALLRLEEAVPTVFAQQFHWRWEIFPEG